MRDILFLCHRLPWPPSKGDKIRSYHVLRRLAKHYRVYLGAFVDDPDDWQYVAAVKAVCADTCIRPLHPWRARLRSLTALVQGTPLTAAYYRDRVMRRWVERLLVGRKVDLALCYSSGVASFLMQHRDLRQVMDFVDVDSDKWRQYAQSSRGPAGVLYRREARQLAKFERAIAAQFNASLFVSEAEAEFFRRQAPESAGKVHGIPNGVDSAYWDPGRAYPSPYPPGQRVVVFVGAMDYWANVDAAQWFAHRVWPQVHAELPAARLYIVGARPTVTVQALAELVGVTVTGRVEDVRPYLAHAHVATAPLRIARGIQNKVLEALAMGKVLLATPQAYEGIEDFAGRQGCVTDSPEIMATEALRWLQSQQPAQVPAARAMVLSRYNWLNWLDAYENVLLNPRLAATVVQAAKTPLSMEACS